MNIFGVGPAEAALIFMIALIVVGPQRFPEVARQAGRWYRIARRFTDEVMTDVRSAVDEIDKEAGASMGLSSVRELVQIGDLSKEIEGAKADAVSASTAAGAAATVDLDASPAAPTTASPTTEATSPAAEPAVAEQPVVSAEAAPPAIASPETVAESSAETPSAETDEQRAARDAAAAAAAARVLSRATGDGA